VQLGGHRFPVGRKLSELCFKLVVWIAHICLRGG
jgi:hypothetical protein